MKASDCGGKPNFTAADSSFNAWSDINCKITVEILTEAANQLVTEKLLVPIEEIAASARGGAGNGIFTKVLSIPVFCAFLSLHLPLLEGCCPCRY